MKKLLLFVSLLLATLAAKATEPKIVTFSEENLTHEHVTTALNNASIGANDPWIAVLESSVKILKVNLSNKKKGTFDAEYGDARCANLQSVQGGEGVTRIGDKAFRYCTSLSSVSFPKVTDIGIQAFMECTSLNSASFPKVKSINTEAFWYCYSLSSVSFPEAVEIYNWAFRACSKLSSVSFPEATEIYNAAFYGCTSLSSISFPKVKSISDYAFGGCENLSSVSFPVATSIAVGAFADCTSLSSVSFPVAESIGWSVFKNCTSLSTLSLGTALSSVKNITFGNDVFSGVTTTNIDLTLGENVNISGEDTDIASNKYKGYTFKSITVEKEVKTITFTKENLTHADVTTALNNASIGTTEPWIAELASTVKTLETGITGTFDADWGDSRCANLQSVQGGEGVTSIGGWTFWGCTSLSSASFPKVTIISNYAFYGCSNLSSASFPVATGIGEEAFAYCTSLSSASFPKVTDIADWAFSDCTSLSTLSLGTALSTETDITFDDDVFLDVTTENIDLTLGENVDVNADGADTDIANKHYKGYTFKSITLETDTSIDNVQAEGKKVVGYYDLSGVKLRTEPESGIYIVTYDDGTSAKRMKK